MQNAMEDALPGRLCITIREKKGNWVCHMEQFSDSSHIFSWLKLNNQRLNSTWLRIRHHSSKLHRNEGRFEHQEKHINFLCNPLHFHATLKWVWTWVMNLLFPSSDYISFAWCMSWLTTHAIHGSRGIYLIVNRLCWIIRKLWMTVHFQMRRQIIIRCTVEQVCQIKESVELKWSGFIVNVIFSCHLRP